MGPPSKEPVEAVVDPRAAPRQSLLEVTYAKLDAKGVGARGVNDLPSRVVLLCENDSRLESAETSGSFWPAVFAAARMEQKGNKTPFAYTGATAVYPPTRRSSRSSPPGAGSSPRSARWRRSSVARDGRRRTARRAKSAVRVGARRRVFGGCCCAFPGWHAGFVEALALDDGYEPLEEARVLKVATKANVAVVELGMRLGAAARAEEPTRRRRRRSARAARALELEDAFRRNSSSWGCCGTWTTARRRSRSSWTCTTPR